MTTATTPPPAGALGLDAGGTQTRWARVDDLGEVQAEGHEPGLSGLQLASAAGREHIAATLRAIAAQAGAVGAVVAGVTGFDAAQQPALRALVAAAFAVDEAGVRLLSDIELACRAAFAPGAGHVVYAGTGAIAAHLDAAGTLHRAGGRGVLIDDAGGGHWIATRALRMVWRAEDEAPGAWRSSPMAQRVFGHIGGSDWAHTRQWAYGATRGELGTLALAVAAAADEDPAALALLQAAGSELARLARALLGRCGALPLALGGRVFDLHPAVENALRAALPTGTAVHRLTTPPHHAAARLAAHRTLP